MDGQQAWIMANSFTKESLLGGGAVVGKNVTIVKKEPINGGTRITFSYTLDDGTPQTDTLDVMNGITPRIGANGNWWIGNEDTGVSAGGASGDNTSPSASSGVVTDAELNEYMDDLNLFPT